MTYFFAVINLIVLILIARQMWKNEAGVLRQLFWPAWFAKLTAGVCLGLIYKYYYVVGDTFLYYQDGVVLSNVARKDPSLYLRFLWKGNETFDIWSNLNYLQSRALFMAKFTSVINLLTHDNYWITSLYFSAISFASSWYLVKTISRTHPTILIPSTISFLFLPSAVFWSSGLIKESLAMAALFFLSGMFVKAWMKIPIRYWEWLVLPASIWVLWGLKYYYLAVFLPLALTSLIIHIVFAELLKTRSTLWRALSWSILFLIPLFAISLFHPNFYPELFLKVIVSNYRDFHAISSPEDLIFYHDLQANIGSVLRNAPWALVSGFFRPFPWEARTLFQAATATENVLLLILTLTAMRQVPRLLNSVSRLKLLTVLLYTIALCLFLALSTPNFGTLSRYRVGFLPFYFLLITIDNPVIIRISRFVQRKSGYLAR